MIDGAMIDGDDGGIELLAVLDKLAGRAAIAAIALFLVGYALAQVMGWLL